MAKARKAKAEVLTKKQKVLNFLMKGKTLTVKQAEKMFKAGSVTSIIASLRRSGFPNIYTNTRVTRDGTKVAQYRYGRPTQEMIEQARKGSLNLNPAWKQTFALQ